MDTALFAISASAETPGLAGIATRKALIAPQIWAR
jgi:hypothetical protein